MSIELIERLQSIQLGESVRQFSWIMDRRFQVGMGRAAGQDLRVRSIGSLCFMGRRRVTDLKNNGSDFKLIPWQEDLVSPNGAAIHEGAVTALQVADDEPAVTTFKDTMSATDLSGSNAQVAFAMPTNQRRKMTNRQ